VSKVRFYSSPFPRGLAIFGAGLSRVSSVSPETSTNDVQSALAVVVRNSPDAKKSG